MPLKLAPRLASIQPSPTLALNARAKALAARGADVVSFAAGEPDFDTPGYIKRAAIEAIESGFTKYTATAGIPELRAAISEKLERENALKFTPEQVMVSVGAKHSLYNLFQALLNPDDEVIIPAPYWVSYPDIVKLAGGKPVIVETRAEDGFRITPAALRAAITPRTRAFILCSPSNPTGACYDRVALDGLQPIFEEYETVVVSDDIYRRLVYGGFQFVEIATLSEKMRELTVVVDGFSKTYSMTGWRLGYAAGPRALVDAMSTLQGLSTSNVTSIAQAAAIAALDGPQECVEEMRREFDERRRVMVARLRKIPGVSCYDPQGAFYAFPDLSAYVGKRPKGGSPLEDDVALCDYLLDVGKIAVVPGSGFGAPGFVRLSYATSMANIQKGLDRMGEALGALG